MDAALSVQPENFGVDSRRVLATLIRRSAISTWPRKALHGLTRPESRRRFLERRLSGLSDRGAWAGRFGP